MSDPIQSAITSYRLHVLRNSKGAMLLAVTVLGLLVAAVVARTWEYGEPPELVEAEVVRFGSVADYVGDQPLVIVRLSDGSIRQLTASPGQLQNCRSGSAIGLVKTRLAYRVSPEGCVRRQ